MTGLELYTELVQAARAMGVSVSRFVRPIANHPDTFLGQLREARRPLPRTIERVRALIEGRPIPVAEVEARSSAPRVRQDTSLTYAIAEKTHIEKSRDLTELAHATRRPGQTLADRVHELRQSSQQDIAA